MSEKTEESEDLPKISEINGNSTICHEETTDKYLHHKSKKKKKEKERDKTIENDDNRTYLDLNEDNNPTNRQIDSSTNSEETHESTLITNGNTTHNLETEKLDKTVKIRRGKHKQRAEDKLNKNEEQVVDDANQNGHITTEQSDGHPDERNVEKWEKKLVKKKLEYKEEKNNLKQKLKETKEKFEEEIKKYENDLSDKRKEYLAQLGDLQFDDEMRSMARRMEELQELEDELDRRFKQCVDFEMEIEQAEKFLDRRGEICKNREEELKNLDEELDILHKELELDKERLQGSGVNVNTILASKRGERFNQINSSFPSHTEDDYILKANLRKAQEELKSTKHNLELTTEKLNTITDEYQHLQSEKKKNDQKIKHLETQLAVALGQLTQRNLTGGTTTPLKNQDRYRSAHKHITINRLNEDGLLSINQQAQLRRKNSTDRSSSSDGGRLSRNTNRKVSRLTSGLEPSTSDGMGSSEGSGSVIGDQVIGSVVSENTSSKSTTCRVM